jgi:transcriptional regulator with XRE-family HTH domain
MDASFKRFGTELRRRRVEAGLSLTGLEKLVHYSRSHLSKVETGAKPPSTDLARRCDAALGCAGALAGLAPAPKPDAPSPATGDCDEVWVLSFNDNGTSEFRTVSRRSLLGGALAGLGAPAITGSGFGLGPSGGGRLEGSTLDSFRVLFDELRSLGQRVSPGTLVPMLVTQTHSLRTLATQSRSAERDRALVLAARFAEYTGWMAQEAGDDARAAWWTEQAVNFSAGAGDTDMAAYALVRRGLIALYRHDSAQTVQLAAAAQSATRDPRIRGLAAQREAQGHAIAGDYDACFRALDRASGLLGVDPEPRHGAILGTSSVADPIAAAVGWCLFDLGQPATAAQVLQRELARIPDQAKRARARYGARLALALAGSGEPEAACAAAGPVLDACENIDSATVRVDLRSLSRELNRWHCLPEVQETRQRLITALHVG